MASMRIDLNQILPQTLPERSGLSSDIWGISQVLETPGFYEICAPSGRGKTTFVHILYGLRGDFSGELRIDGQDVKQLSARKWAELRQASISIVFQDLRLFPQLTAWENIQVKHVLQPSLGERQLRELCSELGIAELLDKPTEKISFGEQQRVALVRALCQPFCWLLLDEPFSHLDSANIVKVCRVIHRECQRRSAGCLLMKLDPTRYFEDACTLNL
jgi:ABC-type lipoprotein export system ATPase subunit